MLNNKSQMLQNMVVSVFPPDEKLKLIITDYYLIKNQCISHDIIPPLGFSVIKFHLKNNVKEFYCNYTFKTSDAMIVGQLSKFAKIKQHLHDWGKLKTNRTL